MTAPAVLLPALADTAKAAANHNEAGVVSTGYRTIRIDALARLNSIAFNQP